MRYLIFIILLIGCTHNDSKRNDRLSKAGNQREPNVLPCVVDTSMGDTTAVSFSLSGLEYAVHYYHGKPQYIRIKKSEKPNHLILSYERDTRGVFIALNDSLDVMSFGCKYLYGNESIVCYLDSLKQLESLELNNSRYNDTPLKINLHAAKH
jgi:hypothetical protein